MSTIRLLTSRPPQTPLHRCVRHMSTAQPQQQQQQQHTKPHLPDFNTRVDVHNITLQPPKHRQGSYPDINQLQHTTRGSLIPQTLAEMEAADSATTATPPSVTAKQLRASGTTKLTLQQRKQVRRSLHATNTPSFWQFIEQQQLTQQLQRYSVQILQLNIGLYCNQACNHCHVESSPKRINEQMNRQTADRCIQMLLASDTVHTVDLTGGAPDLCQEFRYLVSTIRQHRPDITIIDRCNLTALLEPDQADLAQFLAKHKVHVIASLPCYSKKNVDQQRGNHVFERSIRALHLLNDLGYGTDPSLPLTLVYNPNGGFLPPEQGKLEAQYKQELMEQFGIVFNNLLTITNMPIRRFADFLYRRDELNDYMHLLVRNFNPNAVSGVMCTNTVSVDWQGYMYDCDFNQQLGMNISDIAQHPLSDNDVTHIPVHHADSANAASRRSVFDVKSLDDLVMKPIATDAHCFGCTAGAGSSCQGATAATA